MPQAAVPPEPVPQFPPKHGLIYPTINPILKLKPAALINKLDISSRRAQTEKHLLESIIAFLSLFGNRKDLRFKVRNTPRTNQKIHELWSYYQHQPVAAYHPPAYATKDAAKPHPFIAAVESFVEPCFKRGKCFDFSASVKAGKGSLPAGVNEMLEDMYEWSVYWESVKPGQPEQRKELGDPYATGSSSTWGLRSAGEGLVSSSQPERQDKSGRMIDR